MTLRVFSLALPLLLLTLTGASPDIPEASPQQRATPQQPFTKLPVSQITVDLSADQGPLELWRQAIGHGGINTTPLPDRVIAGTAALHPRLIRIFIQEFFNIYPEHGKFDWTRLDPYMDSFAKTGAKVVAAITIKPRPIFPNIDQKIWRPNEVEEWQRVIAAMVKRYSVDKPLVTYWEIGNETDIGENGGCPYLISDPKDYAEFYKLTVAPILAAFPQAKVGGTAVANAGGEYLPKFIEICKAERLRLDFISWHLYSDSPESHAGLVRKYRKLLEDFGQIRPEMLVTEWSKSFDPVSVEDLAFDTRRSAIIASCILAMKDAGVDWSFYYHLWDQVCYVDQFRPFFQNPDIMYHHWNEVPHRFALFGVGQVARPQYFVYKMLTGMGDRRVRAQSTEKDLRVLASKSSQGPAVFLVNHAQANSQDRIAIVKIAGLQPGRKQLVIYRIDRGGAWSDKTFELLALEKREVDVKDRVEFQVFCPAESVCLLLLQPIDKPSAR